MTVLYRHRNGTWLERRADQSLQALVLCSDGKVRRTCRAAVIDRHAPLFVRAAVRVKGKTVAGVAYRHPTSGELVFWSAPWSKNYHLLPHLQPNKIGGVA